MLNAKFPLRDEVEPTEVATDPDQANTDATEEAKEQADLAQELADAKSKLDELEDTSDRNIRKLQGSYQSQVNQLRAQKDQDAKEAREAIDTQIMSGMEESDAMKYRNLRLEEEVEESNKRIVEMQRAVADSQARAGYTSQFLRYGVDPRELNTRGSAADLAESGWDALSRMREAEQVQAKSDQDALAKMQAELEAVQAGLKTPTPAEIATSQGDLVPPNVATQTPGEVTGPRSWTEAREAQKDFFGFLPSEEDLIRAFETGQLPASVLPGLETGPPPE